MGVAHRYDPSSFHAPHTWVGAALFEVVDLLFRFPIERLSFVVIQFDEITLLLMDFLCF